MCLVTGDSSYFWASLWNTALGSHHYSGMTLAQTKLFQRNSHKMCPHSGALSYAVCNESVISFISAPKKPKLCKKEWTADFNCTSGAPASLTLISQFQILHLFTWFHHCHLFIIKALSTIYMGQHRTRLHSLLPSHNILFLTSCQLYPLVMFSNHPQ